MKKYKTTDEVCEDFANKNAQIKIKQFDNYTILIEGDSEGLEFLGNLILTQAKCKNDCKKSLAPKGAGSKLFSRGSDLGIVLHRIPCEHGKIKVPSKPK